MAQCLLHHGWLVLLKTGACCGLPIFFEVTTNWRAGCQKLACPVRREGRPESSSLPLSTPYRTRRSALLPASLSNAFALVAAVVQCFPGLCRFLAVCARCCPGATESRPYGFRDLKSENPRFVRGA